MKFSTTARRGCVSGRVYAYVFYFGDCPEGRARR